MFVTYERDGDVGVITLTREPLNTYDELATVYAVSATSNSEVVA